MRLKPEPGGTRRSECPSLLPTPGRLCDLWLSKAAFPAAPTRPALSFHRDLLSAHCMPDFVLGTEATH